MRLPELINSPRSQLSSGSINVVGILSGWQQSKKSQAGNAFSLWNIYDLKSHTSVKVFLFGEAFRQYCGRNRDGLACILSDCGMMDDKGSGTAGPLSLRISDARKIIPIGMSKDYGYCAGKVGGVEGRSCRNVVDRRGGGYCEYHAKQDPTKSKQGELLIRQQHSNGLYGKNAKVIGNQPLGMQPPTLGVYAHRPSTLSVGLGGGGGLKPNSNPNQVAVNSLSHSQAPKRASSSADQVMFNAGVKKSQLIAQKAQNFLDNRSKKMNNKRKASDSDTRSESSGIGRGLLKGALSNQIKKQPPKKRKQVIYGQQQPADEDSQHPPPPQSTPTTNEVKNWVGNPMKSGARFDGGVKVPVPKNGVGGIGGNKKGSTFCRPALNGSEVESSAMASQRKALEIIALNRAKQKKGLWQSSTASSSSLSSRSLLSPSSSSRPSKAQTAKNTDGFAEAFADVKPAAGGGESKFAAEAYAENQARQRLKIQELARKEITEEKKRAKFKSKHTAPSAIRVIYICETCDFRRFDYEPKSCRLKYHKIKKERLIEGENKTQPEKGSSGLSQHCVGIAWQGHSTRK